MLGSSKFVTDIRWYKTSETWSCIYYVCVFLSGGLLFLASYLDPVIGLWFTTTPCQAKESEYLSAKFGGGDGGEIAWCKCSHQMISKSQSVIILENRSIRYFASRENGYALEKVPEVPNNFMKFILPLRADGYTGSEEAENKILNILYGKNETSLPPINAVDIVIRKSLSPFFLFQYFSTIVWMFESYYLFGGLIIVITISAIAAESKEVLYNLASLHKLAGSHNEIQIIKSFSMRGSNVDKGSISSDRLSDTECLPGHHIIIENGMTIPCDAVLVYGRVIVDESSLTGESVPVTKTPILSTSVTGSTGTAIDLDPSKKTKDFDNEAAVVTADSDSICTCDQIALKRSGNVLFSGTKVRALHGDICIAVVFRTGFRSAKGQLIASLLNPKEAGASFIADASKLVFCMLIFTTFMYMFIAILFVQMKVASNIIFLKYLDAITIAVPPALTACLTVSTAISVGRMTKLQVFVSETSCVNVAGSITAACFDKTGTLTEERLDFQGACVVLEQGQSGSLVERNQQETMNKSDHMICQELMASCHNLAIVDGDAPNGDPLEVEQLNACKWSIAMKDNKMVVYPRNSISEDKKYIVHKHFEFTPERLRAGSVLIRPNKSIVYLLKGSPEMIISLSKPNTVPANVSDMLIKLAKRGLRVIAMAYQNMDRPFAEIEHYTQDQIEAMGNLTFYGLLFFSSKLKAATVSTIQALHNADISVKMITGDHIHTGIAVAMECKIIHSNPKFKNVIIDEDEKSEDHIKIIDAFDDSPLKLSLDELLDYLSMGNGASNDSNTSSSSSSFVATNPLRIGSVELPGASQGQGLASKLFNNSHDIQVSVTGKALQAVRTHHSPTNFSSLVRYGRVFARTKPLDKKTVVDELKKSRIIDERRVVLLNETGFYNSIVDTLMQKKTHLEEKSLVLFCGDGANDMQALRAANVGVSLCAAETSVAAPITSTMQDPGSCIDVLKEGRASLCTAYVLVTFNILYGVIQLFMCMMMYRFGLIVGDYQYLIQDLFFTLVLGVVISMTPPTKVLSRELPPKRFLHPYLLAKLLVQIIIFISFQLIALNALENQPWYTKTHSEMPLTNTYSWEATVINNMALFQLMIASIVATIGPPFLESWTTNPYHVGVLCLQFAWVMFQVFGDPNGDNKFMEDRKGLALKPVPAKFGLLLTALMFINLAVSCLGSYLTENVRKFSLQTVVEKDTKK